MNAMFAAEEVSSVPPPPLVELIVMLSVKLSVVIVILVPATRVRVSEVESATTVG
jgi:hypothetical protein